MLQEAKLHHIGGLGHTDAFAEITDRGGGVAPAAQAAEGGHTGIVPAGDPALLYQSTQLAFGHDGVVDAQASELDLPGAGGQLTVLDNPIIERPVGLKLQGAEAVGDALQGILNGVGEVVHGVDAPLVALAMVAHVVDAVDNRVAHIEVAAGKVDLSTQGHGAVGEFPGAHTPEQVQTFLDRPVPVGGDGRHTDVAPVGLELLGGQLAHIGQTLLDEQHRLAVILLKIVAAEEETVAPIEAQPVDVLLDGAHKLLILLGGVGVVHTEVAQTAKLLSGTEVDAQGLAVADVQVTVGLRGKTGVDGHALVLAAGSQVLGDEIVNKVAALGALGLVSGDDFVFLAHIVLLLIVNYCKNIILLYRLHTKNARLPFYISSLSAGICRDRAALLKRRSPVSSRTTVMPSGKRKGVSSRGSSISMTAQRGQKG